MIIIVLVIAKINEKICKDTEISFFHLAAIHKLKIKVIVTIKFKIYYFYFILIPLIIKFIIIIVHEAKNAIIINMT